MGELLNGLINSDEEFNEKTAGLLDGLKNMKGHIRQAMPKAKQMSPLQDALNKAKYDAYNEMLKNNLTKKAFISQSELEKLALLQKIPQPKYNMFGRGALEQANSAPYKPLSLKPLKNNFYTGRWKEVGGDKLLNNAKQKVQNFTNPIPPPVAPAPPINPNALQGGAEQAAKQGFNMGKNFKLKAAGIGLAAIGTAAYLGSQRKKRENMNKYSASEYDEEEKIAVTKEEKEQLRRMTGMAKRKIKKQKPNKTKESTYRMKKQKKHADFTDAELEKMASLMADQFIAASALSAADSENMNLEEEIIAGYKAYIDEVNA